MSHASDFVEMPVARGQNKRDVWVDNLRTFMVVLVVNMHACCTYSHVGSWYVTEGPDPGLAAKIPFFFWQGHLQAFFMGLMFFLAGHFAHHSLERRTATDFLSERFRRLMVPTIFYMLVLHPFIVVGINPYGIPAKNLGQWLLQYYGSFKFVGETGPLWFALTLFIFSVLLVAGRSLFSKIRGQGTAVLVTWLAVVGFGVLLVTGTFLVRLQWPIGSKVLNLQFCFFFQYCVVFAAGVASARNAWLHSFARSRLAVRVGLAGLLGGPLFLGVMLWAIPPVGSPPAFVGGWSVPAFLMAFWEQMSGVALGVGSLALFTRFGDRPSIIAAWLGENSFGIYLFHAPVLVAFTGWMAGWSSSPIVKTLSLTIAGVVATALVSDSLRKLPWVRRFV